MKKTMILYVLFLCICITIRLNTVTFSANEQSIAENETVIPQNAIRFRIIAHSNLAVDQHIKYVIRDQVHAFLWKQMSDVHKLEQARIVVENNLHFIHDIVEQTLHKYDRK